MLNSRKTLFCVRSFFLSFDALEINRSSITTLERLSKLKLNKEYKEKKGSFLYSKCTLGNKHIFSLGGLVYSLNLTIIPACTSEENDVEEHNKNLIGLE